MEKKILCIALVLFCAAFILKCESRETRSFSTPFIDVKAAAKNPNSHVPKVTYAPLVLLDLINPDTKQQVRCLGYLDTGADYCFVSKEVVDRLGAKPDGQPPLEVRSGGGTASLHSTIIEHVLAGTGEVIRDFPIQKAPFFIQDSWLPADMVLGNIRFLDRFREVRIAYPKSISLVW